MYYLSLYKEEELEYHLKIKQTKVLKNKIILLNDDSLKNINKNVNYFSGYKDLFLNKYETYIQLKKNKIPTVTTKKYKTSFIAKNKLITKPIDGTGRIKYLIWEKGEEVLCKNNMIIQPFINGKEYNIDLLCDGVNFITCIKEKLEIKAGRTWSCIEVDNEEIEKLCRIFISKYPFYGTMDIDIVEENGNYFILDINTRFGGGILHSLNLNNNFKNELFNLIHIDNYKLKRYDKKLTSKKSFYSFKTNLEKCHIQ